MVWIVSLFFIVNYFIAQDPVSIIAAGLFAIAGSISTFGSNFESVVKRIEVVEESDEE